MKWRTIKELQNLDGRIAIVAGAGHIGKRCAETLAELGADIAIADIRDESPFSASLQSTFGVRSVHLAADFSSSDSTKALPAQVANALGPVDIIVYAAALTGASANDGWAVPLTDQTTAAFEAGMRVNVTAAFELIQAARPVLCTNRVASIILFSSIYGLVAPQRDLYDGTQLANPVGYGASKGAMKQLVRYFAAALAPSVRVNAISPGGVHRGQPKEFCDRYSARTPLKRMATEEDIKGSVAFLASDLSSYVTGHDMVVDGGWTAW
jgi:NAD(P)-dependent dehydrogenase (short-subunit alcohol dehydrogenase family)